MAKGANQKLKALYILELLRKESDEEHPVPMKRILSYLEQSGVKAERKSVYSDIEALQTMGYDVMYQAKPSGYYLGEREFELPELKLLVDAVQASKFITEKQSNQLIRKLEQFTSRHEADRLQRQVRVRDRIKSANFSTLYLVDDIHQAIHGDYAISFIYLEWNRNKELVPRHEGKRYVVSPWMLLWEDENYYLLAYDHEAAMIKYFRVDKMKEISGEDGPRQGQQEFLQMDPDDLSKKIFGMFAGEKKRVELIFENDLIGVAIDRFGKDILVFDEDENHFRTTVEVNISGQFYGWLTGVGSGVKIAAPKEEREKYRKYLENILNL